MTFKLQFLEEAAEEKRKIKKGKGKGAREAKKGAGAIAAKGAFGSVGSAVGSLPVALSLSLFLSVTIYSS